jgi:hypothetical protein
VFSEGHRVLYGLVDFETIWKIECLEREREWGVIATDSLYWCLKVKEALLLDFRCQLSAKATSHRCLVSNDAATSLLY